MSSISFHYSGISYAPLHKRLVLREFLLNLFIVEGLNLSSLVYVFTTEEYLLELNKKYLKHDFYTDIITFNLSNVADEIIGEVYISVPRVKENAETHQKLVKDELLRVIIHGALHLCNYKDKKKSEITIMRGKEDEYLRLFEDQLKNCKDSFF